MTDENITQKYPSSLRDVPKYELINHPAGDSFVCTSLNAVKGKRETCMFHTYTASY